MRIQAIAVVTIWAALTAAQKPKKDPPESALDQTLKQVAAAQGTERLAAQPGSLWTPTSLFSDLTSDLRARRVGDIVTILVQEKASAVSSGTVKTQRNSSLQASITAAGGITRATGPLANLAKAGTTSALDGQGATTRDTTLTATISAVVTQVLPNGSLVIQGTKNVKINNENQILGLRGMVRPVDLDTTNTVSSDRIAQMDLQVNGKGIVGDQIKRPFILYRLLMDILP
jgi:flagellar L-ring protein precursor FlgH